MQHTKIIWTEHTWNPASGCEKVSSGCKHCYAETIATRQEGSRAFPNGFGLTLRPHKLKEPRRIPGSALIFVNSMSDLFWEQIDDDYRDKILDVIEECQQHQFQVLTKRPENMLRYSKRRKLPDNFWAGVTIESQQTIGRLDILRKVDASIRFVSAEPLIRAINFFGELRGIHWMITGGESGSHLMKPRVCEARALVKREVVGGRSVWSVRPSRLEWVRSIRDACLEQDVRFFHKQWGGSRPESGGRTLDGRTWDEFPREPDHGWKNKHLDEKRVGVAKFDKSGQGRLL